MADNDFRSYRSRDAARDEVDPAGREGSSDPLAELARLIGQSDPYDEGGDHETYSPAQAGDDTANPGLEWTVDDGYDEQPADDRYAPPSPADSYPSHAPPSYARPDRGYENEPPAGSRSFSAPAAKRNGSRDDAGDYQTADNAYYRDERQPVSSGRQLPAFTSRAPDDRYETDAQEHDRGQAYAADDYYDDDPNPRRRSGFIVVMAVLGLAVVGTAGAFAYRSMFGASVLPTLPPIIKAGNGPNKITPNYGDAQASNSSQAGVASAGSTEKLVSREEQPVDIQEPPKTAPRVVSTIPISPGSNAAPPGTAASVAPAAAPGAVWPPAAPPAPMAAPVPPAAPAPVSSEPKKIHTVIIRADQSGADAAAVAPAPPPPARSATRTSSPAPKPSVAAVAPAPTNQPLSLVPNAQGEAPLPPPPRTRTSIASVAPATAAAPSSGGGYAVQVTSQRSEAEAQAAFRSLRAKFPDQLGGREPIVRRADLGAKGIYYRALVGPFASMEAAAGMCSSLKAAGGNCLVQRD